MPLWKLLHIKAPPGALRLVEFVPVLIGAGVLFMVFSGKTAEITSEEPEPTPTTVQQARFEPLTLNALVVSPSIVKVGEPTTLLNGICNNFGAPISAMFYLGAQEAGVDPLQAKVIDIAGKDTPEGRQRRSLEPGCIGTEALSGPLPATFTPGRWQLVLHVIATGPKGEMQNLTITSQPFRVVE